jgi:hypothetical protein
MQAKEFFTSNLKANTTKQAVQWLTFYSLNLELLGLNISWDNTYLEIFMVFLSPSKMLPHYLN